MFIQTDTEAHSTAVGQPRMMHAMVYDDYGDSNVLHIGSVDLPIRQRDQVLIEVWASSVNPIDYRIRSGEIKFLLPGGFPRVPGYDVAGVVEDCSSDAPFQIGDRVMAFLDSARGGACADYAVCGIESVAKLPEALPTDIRRCNAVGGNDCASVSSRSRQHEAR